MSALVICIGGGIGDVLLATPVMGALRERYGDVVALTTRDHHPVLRRDPELAEVWSDERPFGETVKRIARAKFDAAIVTWATPRAAALPFAARIPVRVGQARRLYSGAFTHRVQVRSEFGDRTTHWTQILLDFARAVGCDTANPVPRFAVTSADRFELHGKLQNAGIAVPYIVLHPTRGISSERPWPTARLAELASALAQTYAAQIVVTGSAADAPVAAEIARASGAISLAGRTSIADLGALAEGALAVVAMDSGPMHVAAAVGAPTVGIFALQSDEPDRWAPLGPRTAVVRATYPCPPSHRKETCPDFACVANLEVPRVLATLAELLVSTARGAGGLESRISEA